MAGTKISLLEQIWKSRALCSSAPPAWRNWPFFSAGIKSSYNIPISKIILPITQELRIEEEHSGSKLTTNHILVTQTLDSQEGFASFNKLQFGYKGHNSHKHYTTNEN